MRLAAGAALSSALASDSTGVKGSVRPKASGPNAARASGVRIISGVEMPSTRTRCP